MISDTIQTIKHNKIWSVIVVILSIISFWISLNAFTNAMALYTQLDMVKDMFYDGTLESTYTLKITNMKENQATTIIQTKQFIEKLGNDVSVGAFYETGEFFNELENNVGYIEKNKILYKNTYRENQPKISEVIYIDKEMLKILDTNINIDTFENDESEYLPMIVGIEYKDVLPIGTILTLSRTNQKYIVNDYIENDKWLNNDDYISFAPVSLNFKFIIPFSADDEKDDMTQESTNGKIFISFSNEKNIDSYLEQINDYTQKNNLKITILSISEQIKNYQVENQSIVNSNIYLAIMVSICSITSIISVISILVLMRKKEYGIKIAFGYTKRKIILSLISEVIILEIISSIIAFGTLYLKKLSSQSIFNEVYLQTLSGFSILYLIFLLVVVCFLILLLPLVIVNRYEPSDLIKGSE